MVKILLAPLLPLVRMPIDDEAAQSSTSTTITKNENFDSLNSSLTAPKFSSFVTQEHAFQTPFQMPHLPQFNSAEWTKYSTTPLFVPIGMIPAMLPMNPTATSNFETVFDFFQAQFCRQAT